MQANFIDFVFNFFSDVKKNDLKLIYNGEISHEIIKAFTSLTESNLKAKNEANPTQKKVFNIMVECLQNISKHSSSIEHEYSKNGKGILLIGETKDSYNITTGNTIKSEFVDVIKTSIDKVNSLDKNGLRELYKKKLSSGVISDKGGAGLGFIDIRRKSNNKLSYNFTKIDDDNYFYILKTVINKL